MSTETWGLLPKAQDNAQTIEELVDAKIAEHEAEPTSHMGDGESIDEHRKNTIVDHPAGSILTDKFSNSELWWQTNFSDHALWTKHDVHDYDYPGLSIPEDGTYNTTSSFNLNFANVMGFALPNTFDYYFQCFINTTHDEDLQFTTKFGFGIAHTTQYDGFGFKIVNNVASVFYKIGANENTANLGTDVLDGYHLCRAQFVASEQKVYFFIDGEEVAVLDKPAGTSSDQVFWGASYKNETDTTDFVSQLRVMNLLLTRFAS